MRIIDETISRQELSVLAQNYYGEMIKAVADIDKGILAVDAELHSDLERYLIECGSAQESLWGFNLYPELFGEDFVEFDSLINIRPRQNNMSRDIESAEIRTAIMNLVNLRIK